MALVLTVVKVAKKADAIVARIGLNPAMTGDSLGRFPGALSYMVMRSIAGSILHSVGHGNAQNSCRNPNTPAGGPHITTNGPIPPKSDGAGSMSMGSVNVNSNQSTTSQQSQNTQFGAQQSSVSEHVSGNSGGSNAYDTRRTSVPLGTCIAPGHIRPTVQTNPPGAPETNPANGSETEHGTAERPSAAPAESRFAPRHRRNRPTVSNLAQQNGGQARTGKQPG